MTPPSTNLRPVGDRFVGRAQELADLATALESSARLVTLAGTAGVGKTRLALELALRLAPRFSAAGGAWFCNLREARDMDALCRGVAKALAIPLAGVDAERITQVGRALAARGAVLLVLDNLEQIAGSLEPALAPWLASAPEVRILATSREPLLVPGERLRRLEPLPVPEVGDEALDMDSVALFFDRAALARGAALDTAVHGPAVTTLVRRLDGLPLAIELAAARTLSMTPADLLARLSTRLDLLVDGPRAFGMRRTALRTSIEASWEMLDDFERTALAQTSVFCGAFSLEAAEAVLAPTSPTPGLRAPPVALLLESLCAKSLMVNRSTDERPGDARFSLYECIRAFAAEQLEGDARRRAEERHAESWLAAVSAPRRSGSSAPAARAAFARLALARDDLLAIVERALASPPTQSATDRALLAALALEQLERRDAPLAYAALLDRVIERAEGAAAQPLVGRALLARGLAYGALRWEAMALDLEAARRLGETLADAELEGLASLRLAVALLDRGAHSEAARLHARAAELAPESEGNALGAMAAAVGGLLRRESDELDDAMATIEAACRSFAEQGDLHSVLLFGFRRGSALADAQRLDEAAEVFDSTRALASELGYVELEAGMGYHLAGIDFERGRLEHAEEGFRRARDVSRRAGLVRLEGLTSVYLGQLLTELGRTREARESLKHARDALGGPAGEALVAVHLGTLEAHEGRLEAAEACFDRADRLLGGDAPRRVFLEVCRGHADVCRARRSAASGDANAEQAALARARERLERAADADRSQDVRLAARVLRARLASSDEDTRALVVGPDARWFRPPRGNPVTFHKQAALRRLLDELTGRRIAAPGTAVGLDALVAVGWPAEAIQREAAANRLYVAIATLRRLGLRGLLVRRDDGWLLDPSVAVARSPETAPVARASTRNKSR